MDWVAAAQGIRERRKEDLRSRQEMAKAFAEFKAANPYASAAEFQDFIDRFSGGRNYIAGGAPSGSILRAVGMENQKRKAQDEMRQRLADIQTRQQTIQSLQQLADNALLGMEGDDYDAIKRDLAGQFGPDGSSMISGFNLNITPTRRQTLVAEKMRSLLPGALDLARNNGGLLKAADISAMFPGIEKSMIEPLVTEANRVRQKEIDDEKQKKALDIANTEATIRANVLANPNFLSAVRLGDKAAAQRIVDNALKPYAGVYGAEAFSKDFSTSILDEATQSAEAIQLTEHQKLYADAQAKQTDAVTKLDEEALSSVNRAFRASENGTPSVLTGKAGPNGLLAAQYLARMFDTSRPEALDALSGLFAMEDSAGKTVEQLITEGAQSLTSAGVPSMDFAKQQATMARGVNLPEMKSFTAWRSETITDIRADFSAMDEEVRRVASITDPEQLKTEVARLTSQLSQLRKLHVGAIQDARVNQNIWIPVGEEGWNDAQVFGQQGSVVSMMDAEVAKLNEKLNLLSTKALEAAQKAAVEPPPSPTETTPPPVVPQTGAERFIEGIGNEAEMDRLLGQGANAIATGDTNLPGASPMSRMWDWLTESTSNPAEFEKQQLKAQTLMNFLRTPAAKRYLQEHPETINLLREDPVAWATQADAALAKQRDPQ